MKKQLVKALTKIGLLSVMGMVIAAGSAQGQSLADKIRANIPFDFMVGDKKLPAGEYSIGRARQESSDTWLLIRSVDGRSYVIRLTSRVEAQEPKDKGTLVFHSYGDQYFLYQVWPAGGSTGRVLFKSHGERELLERKAQDSGRTAMKAQAVGIVTIVAGLQ